jgi:Pentapeptide repeats (8 copies)
MGFLSDLFSAPKSKPGVIIRNVLGEQIDVVNARDLWNQDLRGRNWSHADLSYQSLYGAQCDGINLFGARLYRTDFQKASLRGADLSFSYAAGASFDRTRPRSLRTPLSTRTQTFQSVSVSVSGGCREGHSLNPFPSHRHPRGFSVQAAARP